MTRFKLLVLALLCVSVFSLCAHGQQSAASSLAGRWDAVITNASKIDVPFGLSVREDRSASGGIRAEILNGSESIPFTTATLVDGELKLHLEQYDGTLKLHLEGNELRGEWSRQTAKGVVHYPVRATRHQQRKRTDAAWEGNSLNGQWTFTFDGSATNPDKVAPAEFKQSKALVEAGGVVAEVEGTIAPVSGDYGLLAGTISTSRNNPATFRLSRFDGIHIVLVTGEFKPDGSLAGKLNTQAFTAIPRTAAASTASEAAAEPNPESVTKLKDPSEIFRFSAVDPKTRRRVTQDDPRLKGKPYIVDIFGTWCPNCHDEAPVLVDIYKRYREQGLEIVGLAYEYVDDPARNARLVEVYRKKYGIGFPLLLAGTTDEGQIAKTLPQLVGFGAYPTTIFVGRDGKVHKIHAGFAGPATGERFTETKRRFEENVKAIIAR